MEKSNIYKCRFKFRKNVSHVGYQIKEYGV